jgi:acetoacetate decarboxylase
MRRATRDGGTSCAVGDARYSLAVRASAALQLAPHAIAPVADLPVLEIVEARHLIADPTLGLGDVLHDYLAR